MYDSIFDTPVVISIISSIFFIFVNLSLANNLNNFFSKNKILYNFEYSFLLSFYFVFLIDSVVFNLLILINSKIFTFYLYYILKIICFIQFFQKEKIKKKINIKTEYKVILLFFFIIGFFHIKYDDSISIHLNLPLAYLSNFENLDNPLKYAELSLYLNSEVLLINSILFKSSNIGNLLNFVALSIFLISSSKKIEKNNFLILFFSMPLVLFLLNTQKLQIFFAILYLVIFIYFNNQNKKKINKSSLTVILFLLVFYISGKLSYAILSIPLIIFIFWKLRDLYFLKYLFYGSMILIFPIILKKYLLYGDPIAPFLSNLLNTDLEYKNLLKTISNQGWKAEDFKLLDFAQFFIPWKMSYLSAATGVGFLYVIYKNIFSKFQYYFIVSISGIFLIYLSGQIMARFYLESILLLFWFSNFKINKIINYILKFQLLIIITTTFLFIVMSLINISKGTEVFMDRFSYTYFNAKKIHNLNLKGNIILLNQERDSIFYNKNIFTFRVRKNTNYLIDTIIKYRIKYIITDNTEKIPKCIKFKLVKEIQNKNATRNFLKKEKFKMSKIFQITENKCKT